MAAGRVSGRGEIASCSRQAISRAAGDAAGGVTAVNVAAGVASHQLPSSMSTEMQVFSPLERPLHEAATILLSSIAGAGTLRGVDKVQVGTGFSWVQTPVRMGMPVRQGLQAADR